MAIFICGQVIDAVVYRFDYSKVAMIISKEHQTIAKEIGVKLDRGATFLDGQGAYSLSKPFASASQLLCAGLLTSVGLSFTKSIIP